MGSYLKSRDSGFFKLVVVEQHAVQTGHQRQVASVHDILPDDRVRSSFTELCETGIGSVSGEARTNR